MARFAVAMVAMAVALSVSAADGSRSVAPATVKGSGFLNVLPPTLPAHGDDLALLRALSEGDAEQVRQLADKLELNPVSKDLFDAQLQYDMPGLLDAANRCRSAAFDKYLLPAAARCNGIAFGAALVTGDVRALFESLTWAKETGFPALTHRFGAKRIVFDNGFDQVDVRELARSLAPTNAHITQQHTVIPIVNWRKIREHDSVPTAHPRVNITVNGHTVQADIDTGAPLPLTIGRSYAKRLNIRILSTGLTALPTLNAPTRSVGDAALGLASTFTLGPLTINNLPVSVVPDKYALDGVVIGLSVLARFKQVTFSNDRITVDTKSEAPCTQPLPLTYAAAGTNPLGQLIFVGVINGEPITATFDSGNNVLLSAGTRLSKHLRESPTSSLHSPVRHGYLALDLPNGQVSSYNATFFPFFPGPPDVLLGAPVLSSADVTLTFSPPMLCIVPKH